jgi:glycosyltransferase involved in cell wall biosynthesis
MRTPVVSVVVPTYNRAAVVVEMLASVQAQTCADFEIVLVDDGSTDDTGERVRALGEPRLRYVRKDNGGVSSARNHGLRLAQGEIIAFVDSDDLWKPDTLERIVDFFGRHPEAGAVFGDVVKHDGEVYVPSFARDSPAFSRLLARHAGHDEIVFSQREMYLCLLEEVPILPSAFAVRAGVVQAAGRFDESWTSSEDWEWFLRLVRHTCFGYLDRALAVLRVSSDSLHRVHADRGRTMMLRLLAGERARVAGDAEAERAVRRGIVRLRKHMAWQHIRAGQPLAAFGTYVTAYREARDPRLLVRAVVALLPLRAHMAVRRRLGHLVEAVERPPTAESAATRHAA